MDAILDCDESSTPAADTRRYRCVRCQRTFDTDLDRCSACGAGRLVPMGPAFDGTASRRCGSCGDPVDPRDIACPNCGSSRFEGVR